MTAVKETTRFTIDLDQVTHQALTDLAERQGKTKAALVVTSLALLIFGAVKGKITSISPLQGALETFMVGSLAAEAA